ncbi:hypothetical protein CDIK_3538 [Cucumispora dikerogammari]|nr:hypothetical protein CDIK_3538 [Cucumispora dikerogammari]
MLYLSFKTHIPDIPILMLTSVLTSLQSNSVSQDSLNKKNKNFLNNDESKVNSPMFFSANIDPCVSYSSDTSLPLSLLSNKTIENTHQYSLDNTLTNTLNIHHANSSRYSAVSSDGFCSKDYNIKNAETSEDSEIEIVYDGTSQNLSKENISDKDNITILPPSLEMTAALALLELSKVNIVALDIRSSDRKETCKKLDEITELSDLTSTEDSITCISYALEQKDLSYVTSSSEHFTHGIEDLPNTIIQSNQDKAKTDINLKTLPNEGENITIAHFPPSQNKNCNYDVHDSSEKHNILLPTNLFNTCKDELSCSSEKPVKCNKIFRNNNVQTTQTDISKGESFFLTRHLSIQKTNSACDREFCKRKSLDQVIYNYNPPKKKCFVQNKTAVQNSPMKECLVGTTDEHESEQKLNPSEFKSNISSKKISSIVSLNKLFQSDAVAESNIQALGIELIENPRVVLSGNNHSQKRKIFISKDSKNGGTSGIIISDFNQKRPLANATQEIHYFKLTERLHKVIKEIKREFYLIKDLSGEIIFEPSVFYDIDLSQIKTRTLYFFSFLNPNKINIKEYIEEPKTPELYLKQPHIIIFNLEKKGSCFHIDYTVKNIPYFFVDCFFKQANGIIVKSAEQQLIEKHYFLSALNISVTILQLNSFNIRDLIPNLLLKHQQTDFCRYFSEKIKQWKFSIKYFISDESREIQISKVSNWEVYEYTGSEKPSIRYKTVRRALIKLEDHCVHDNISDLGNLKKVECILIKFKSHIEKISELGCKDLSSIIVEIRKALTLFQEQKLTIFTNKNYTMKDCELLSLYFILLLNYVPFAESLIYIYDTYLIK